MPQTLSGGGVAAYNTPAFKAQQGALREHDVVEISAKQEVEKKKGLSKGARLAIGITAGLGTIAGTAALICKGKANQLQKLYKEKLVLSNLPEKINFVEAKTVQEGIDFAKNVLKIKEVSPDFTLDAINFANKGIVDVANANKGKCFLPKKLIFKNMEDNTLAAVYKQIDKDCFGQMEINKKYFDDNFLTKYLKEHVCGLDEASEVTQKHREKIKEAVTEKNYSRQDLLEIEWSDEFKNIVKRFRKDPNSVSVKEKRTLARIYDATSKEYNETWYKYPDKFIEKNMKTFTDNGLSVDIDEIRKLKTEEQSDKLFDLLKELKEKHSTDLVFKYHDRAPETTIYHEMGHLQDYAKNLEKLDLSRWKFWQKNHNHSAFENHWGGMTYKGYHELFKKDEKAFKLLYPDLHEHWTNKEIQKTADKISTYARTGIGEFIAEVYAELISGAKLSDDVMALYKKYNGPMPGVY